MPDQPQQPRVWARTDVIRHRVNAQFGGHGRHLLAAMAVLAVILITLVTNAARHTGGDGNVTVAATPASVDQDTLLGRERATQRPDRADRDPSPPAATAGGNAQAAAPESSPEPTETESDRSVSEPDDGGSDSAEDREPADARPAADADWVHPMPGATTTSCFGQRWGTLHAGVDLAMPAGTPIRAVGAGTVTDAGWAFSGYGISVVIHHPNGYDTHYAHASEAKVSVGDEVSPGDVIALEGSTGDSTGPHLHFEVHDGMWNQIEPTAWLRERGVNIPGC